MVSQELDPITVLNVVLHKIDNMGKHRSTEEILKAKVTKLELGLKKLRADYLKDQRIFIHKLSNQQNIARMHTAGIMKIVKHLRGRGLWLIEEKK